MLRKEEWHHGPADGGTAMTVTRAAGFNHEQSASASSPGSAQAKLHRHPPPAAPLLFN